MTAEKIYIKPATIDEAISMAYAHKDDFCYVAGGTDVLVNKYQGNKECSCLIDITDITELKSIHADAGNVKIGALVRLDDLKNHKVLAENFPGLLIAAHEVASPMLRKTATLGGNILCENRCSFYNQSEWWREAVAHHSLYFPPGGFGQAPRPERRGQQTHCLGVYLRGVQENHAHWRL